MKTAAPGSGRVAYPNPIRSPRAQSHRVKLIYKQGKGKCLAKCMGRTVHHPNHIHSNPKRGMETSQKIMLNYSSIYYYPGVAIYDHFLIADEVHHCFPLAGPCL